MLDSGNTPLELQVSLAGMRPEDALRVLLPPEYATLRVGELVDAVFPEDDRQRSLVEARFDLQENPDLPEIYSVLLDAFSQWRLGHCTLKFSGTSGSQIELSDPVAQHLIAWVKCSSPYEGEVGRGCITPSNSPLARGRTSNLTHSLQDPNGISDHGSSYPKLEIAIEQEYRALDYAVDRGYWESREKLLEWLQSLTLLYYLDKQEYPLPAAPTAEVDQRLSNIAAVLSAQGTIAASEELGVFTITELGRRTIGGMLAETESHIARFDVFKDVAYDRAAGVVEFDTGRGEDLRVQVYVAEGLDPLRIVFLLRLYDGTFDEFLTTWLELIHRTEFFEEILEPVVNHCQVDESVLGWIIESGYACLEEREDTVREQRSRTEILERLKAL